MSEKPQNIARRPARAYRLRSPFRFIESPKAAEQKATLVAKAGSHIDGRPELRHQHDDLHSPGPVVVMPTTGKRRSCAKPIQIGGVRYDGRRARPATW